MSALVVGVGNAMRGDDGVGAAVAARISGMAIPGVRVVEHAEPLDLVEHLGAGADLVVVVDAVAAAGEPGRVHLWRVGAAPLRRTSGSLGTHGVGVAEAIELARALRRLPQRLVLVGVQGSAFDPGTDLSAEVRSRLDEAVLTVLGLVGGVSEPS